MEDDSPAAAAHPAPPSQVPYLAFAADRRMPGNQPDQFIITQSSANARFLVAANRDVNRCP